ncbi:unnamed protein product [Miscanthus lutarioriparius]|uniref:Serine-rich protein n=1 Tax=Miscanthus lutarioriparius TaxID=422564 RepID=A0A811PBQ2_9POAL|nr:unnamed protein product [Miscanthus lutarioriparius]
MATAVTTRRPSGPVLSAAHYRSASSTRISLAGAGARARPPAGQSVTVSVSSSSRGRRTCMCSPTNHPGSFRCSLHKERVKPASAAGPHGSHGHGKPSSPPSSAASPTTSRLGAGAGRRMGSALLRIGAVEGGECARRALAATARSSPPRSSRSTAAASAAPGPAPAASPPSPSPATAPATTAATNRPSPTCHRRTSTSNSIALVAVVKIGERNPWCCNAETERTEQWELGALAVDQD